MMLTYIRNCKNQYAAWKQEKKNQWHEFIALLSNSTYKREGVNPLLVVLIETIVLCTIVIVFSILIFILTDVDQSRNAHEPLPMRGIFRLIPVMWLYAFLRYVEFQSALKAFWYLVGQTLVVLIVLMTGMFASEYLDKNSPFNVLFIFVRGIKSLLESVIQLPSDTYYELPTITLVPVDFVIFYQIANAIVKLIYRAYLKYRHRRTSLPKNS